MLCYVIKHFYQFYGRIFCDVISNLAVFKIARFYSSRNTLRKPKEIRTSCEVRCIKEH